ncbi:hypothetical protein pb186bvf_010279 [Paramecium bursaria]
MISNFQETQQFIMVQFINLRDSSIAGIISMLSKLFLNKSLKALSSLNPQYYHYVLKFNTNMQDTPIAIKLIQNGVKRLNFYRSTSFSFYAI